VSPYSFTAPAFLSDRPLFSASLTVSDDLEGRKALQIEEPADHERFLPDVSKHSPEESPESVLFFGFSPELLDLFPGSLAQLVEDSSLPHPDSNMFFVRSDLFGGDMGLDLSFEETSDELLFKESFVGSDGFRLKSESFLGTGDQLQNSASFGGGALRAFNIDADQDPVSVLHDGVYGVSRNRGFFGRFRGEPTVGISGRAVSLVGSPLAAPVDGGISRVVVFFDFNRLFFWLRISANRLFIFFRGLIDFNRHKTFIRGVRSDGGAVNAPMAADQSFFHGNFYRVIKEALQNSGFIKAAFSIFGEGRSIPNRRGDVQPHEPTERHVALKLHNELSVGAHSQKVSSQERHEELLGRNTGAAVVFTVEGSAKLADSLGVNERTDLSQGMIFGHKFGDLNRVKHFFLSITDSHHGLLPSVLSATRSLMELFYHVLRGVFQQTVSRRHCVTYTA